MSAPSDPVPVLLRSFCLTTMAGQYEEVMECAEKEGWSHRAVLRHLCESEAVERAQKRTVRLLAESGLPETKTLSTLDEAMLPPKVRRQLPALIDGGFVDRAVNVLAFGLPGRGKTHFLAALGRELILRHSRRVLFRPAFKLVGQLLAAKRDLRLESELKKLDRYDVLVIARPQNARPLLEVSRDGTAVEFRNVGNTNALLFNGRQCAEAETDCAELPSKRIYAGNSWQLELPASGQARFLVESDGGLTVETF